VVEVQSDLRLRATATVNGDVDPHASLSDLVNARHQGRCSITLDPKGRQPGQQPYQGVVPLLGDARQKLEKFSDVLQHYMLQSEQLDTTLVLAADATVAAGLLIQRLPMAGTGNLSRGASPADDDQMGQSADYQRIAMLASSLKREELLSLDIQTILHRLFWDEALLQFEPEPGASVPRFVCSCSRERVSKMLLGLGHAEAQSILQERAEIEVGCDFCAAQYRFDAVDVTQLFLPPVTAPSGSNTQH
jgi:molecular chaperone Hsp33